MEKSSEVEVGTSWEVKVDDEFSRLTEITEAEKKDWEKHCIYKLPASVTDLNKNNAYKPRVISFGPYHYDDPHLRPLESHKHRALLQFLKRVDKSLKYCVGILGATAGELMDAYDCLDSKWRQVCSEKFVMVMIRDGCFMLELLWASSSLSTSTTLPPCNIGYAKNDPVFSNHGKLFVMPYIKRDMLMIENQLPMLLLTTLLSVRYPHYQKEKLVDEINRLIVQFCFDDNNLAGLKLGNRMHVLDVYRRVLLVRDQQGQETDKQYFNHDSSGNYILPSATELHEAGISIKQSKTHSISDIGFKIERFGGVLRLPKIVVDDLTESVYLNLMALERFHVGLGNEVTSYIAFMDDIVDNERDVKLLRSRNVKIVESAYGSDKAVAELFNSLSRDVALGPDGLEDVRREVIKYANKGWNKSRANLCHTYFTNPWTSISLIAAIFLFGLTIVQTVFTVKQSF